MIIVMNVVYMGCLAYRECCCSFMIRHNGKERVGICCLSVVDVNAVVVVAVFKSTAFKHRFVCPILSCVTIVLKETM